MLHILRNLASKSYSRAATVALAVALAACSDSTTAPTITTATVVVSPANRALFAGEQTQLAAKALDASGTELSGRTVHWASSDLGIATVSESGLVTAVGAGATTIRATIDGKSGSSALQVAPAPVATLTLDVAALALNEGDSRALVATPKDAQGNVLTGRAVVWESVNANVATVSAAGVVTAVAIGNTDVRATSEGKTVSVAVSVRAAPVAIVVPADPNIMIEEGDSRTLTAVAKDAAGRILTGRAFAWSSENTAIATVDANGRLTAVQNGRVNVRVASEGSTATIVVNVTLSRVASVSITPATLSLEIGESRQLQVTAKDARGNTLQGRAVQWSVAGGNATVSPSGVVTGKRNGPVAVTATVEAVASTADATVTIGAPYAWDLLYHRNNNGVQEIFTQVLGTSAAPVRINAGTVSRAATASPGGQRIAFAVSMTDLGTGRAIDDIFAVDRNGMNMKQLTTVAGYEHSPSWSPDGARIAYIHVELAGRTDVWVMNADGTNNVNLTADLADGVFPGSPAWSPDGSRIAFSQSVSDQLGTTAKIITMRADGTDKREITTTLTGFDSAPTWSSDGQRIAFMRYFSGDADIAVVSALGGAITRIPLPGLQANPSWSPDGTYIAFQQNDGALTNLYTMRPDGSSVRLRTVDPAWGGGLRATWIRSN